MKKAYFFTQSVMNGTVTMETSVALFVTRELAEQTLADIKADNAKRDLGVCYSKIQETDLYETKDEIPFYQSKDKEIIREMENLTDDSAETAPEAGQDTPDPSMAASFELDKPRKASWKDSAVRTIDRMTSWILYSMTFCFLFGVAGLELSTREVIAYSLMLGMVVGSINNIERVMRELFKKED